MIDFNYLYLLVLQFFSEHILIAVALGFALCYSLYRKTEITVKFLALCLFLVAVLYIMSLLGQAGSTGLNQEDNLIHKSERQLQESSR